MKARAAIILLSVLLSSCPLEVNNRDDPNNPNNKPTPAVYSVVIENASSIPVTFVYNGNEESLGIGGSKTYTLEGKLPPPPSELRNGNNVTKANIIRDGDTGYKIVDVEPIDLIVTVPFHIGYANGTRQVFISAENYIDDNGQTTITMSEGDYLHRAYHGKIYTSEPDFTVRGYNLGIYKPLYSWRIAKEDSDLAYDMFENKLKAGQMMLSVSFY